MILKALSQYAGNRKELLVRATRKIVDIDHNLAVGFVYGKLGLRQGVFVIGQIVRRFITMTVMTERPSRSSR